MGSQEKHQGTHDLLVKKALRLFEERPSERWTVERAAQAVGISRSVLARRFSEALGMPPLSALRHARMKRAAELLTTTDDKLASIADQVGYDSEFAFSRAFFRHQGVRPGTYRRLHQQMTVPVALAA
jgi:AraC-like DNA-binding protein